MHNILVINYRKRRYDVFFPKALITLGCLTACALPAHAAQPSLKTNTKPVHSWTLTEAPTISTRVPTGITFADGRVTLKPCKIKLSAEQDRRRQKAFGIRLKVSF